MLRAIFEQLWPREQRQPRRPCRRLARRPPSSRGVPKAEHRLVVHRVVSGGCNIRSQSGVTRQSPRPQHPPASNKVLSGSRVLIRKLWRWSMHNGLQLSKHVLVGLWWVGITTHRELDDGQSDGPDVRGDGVGADLTGTFSLDTFGL